MQAKGASQVPRGYPVPGTFGCTWTLAWESCLAPPRSYALRLVNSPIHRPTSTNGTSEAPEAGTGSAAGAALPASSPASSCYGLS